MAARRDGSGVFPPTRKSLGQHFLTDPSILGRIVDALAPAPEDVVVEVGPGRGALTEQLLRRGSRVIAIELDRALAGMLRARLSHDERLTVIQGDFLDVSLAAAAGAEYLLVGNVPYYITSPIIFHALQPPRPRRAVYLVQREVAERLASEPGHKEYGALTVNVQALAEVEMLFRVPAGAFVPPPRVESAVVRIVPREHPVVPPELEERFRTFVIAAFGARRKQMRRVLRTVTPLDAAKADVVLSAAGVDPAARPETLSPAEFARLVTLLPLGEAP